MRYADNLEAAKMPIGKQRCSEPTPVSTNDSFISASKLTLTYQWYKSASCSIIEKSNNLLEIETLSSSMQKEKVTLQQHEKYIVDLMLIALYLYHYT